jgi:hypothetical protein
MVWDPATTRCTLSRTSSLTNTHAMD